MAGKQQMLEQLMGLLPEVLPEIEHVNRGRPLAGGSHHQHFLFEVTDRSGATLELVVRIPFSNDERTHRHMLVEHTMLQFLHRQGHDWMPNSLYHGFIGDKQTTPSTPPVPFSIQTHTRGTRPRRISKEQAAELARMVTVLHSLEVSPDLSTLLLIYQTWEDYAQALLAAMQQWFEMLTRSEPPAELVDLLPAVEHMLHKVGATVQARPAFMQAATGRQYIIHGDIGRHNLLQAEGEAGGTSEHGERVRLYLLDWEFAGNGDPAFDIAVIFQSPRLNKQWRKVFTQTYSASVSGNSLENLWQRVAFYEPIVTGHTVLWASGELFKSWPGAQTLYQVAWYARTLHNRLTLIDPLAGEQVATLLDKLLDERFPAVPE